MFQLLLAIIYLSFISLGLPDSMLGAAWPNMYVEFGVPISYAGIISAIISVGTITSSLFCNRLTYKLGTGKLTALCVALTALSPMTGVLSPELMVWRFFLSFSRAFLFFFSSDAFLASVFFVFFSFSLSATVLTACLDRCAALCMVACIG
jgi:hypothetical protein